MSIALFTAISGLRSFQHVLDVVGNNLANLSTPGFKKNNVVFKEMLSQTLKSASSPTTGTGGVNPMQVGLGATIGGINRDYSQGLLETTGRATDMAITGNGFFILKNDMGVGYTRNGSFSIDMQGNLVDMNGYKVQGWMATDGTVNTSGNLTDISIPVGEGVIAKATSKVGYSGNLDASQGNYDPGPPETGGKYISQSIVYDSLGQSHTVTITFTKQTPTGGGASEWAYSAVIDSGTAATGYIGFDKNGKYDAAHSTASPNVKLTLTNGAKDLDIDLDFSSITQLSTPGQYSVVANYQNGYETGVLSSFAIDKNGLINGVYSNGISQTLGQIALANFKNPEGLETGDGGLLIASPNSGTAEVGEPSSNSLGAINTGTLELSNVDISSEFTKMIIAQRAFQANSRVVTVMDNILEEVANLKR